MGDDSDNDWLKKNPVSNPIRMSLRRSNRFFPRSPDMDASLISNPGKQNQNQQLLAIPKQIRRTNIDLSKLKEMKFKIPAAPAPGKATAKRENAGIPRPYNKPGMVQRKSIVGSNMRNDPKPNSSIPKSAESNLRPPQRPSLYFLARRSTLAPPSATRKPGIVERLVKLSESCAKYDTERSVLESSRIINQSTPNDPSAPRSILKQSQSSTRKELTILKPQDTTDKPKAAKRVNFNEKTQEKENIEEKKSEPKPEIQINDFAALEESTIQFTESFKPITFEEPKKETKPEVDKENPVINEIIETCQSKWEELNTWNDKYRRLREAFAAEFKKRSQFESDELFYNKFCLYRAKREEIYERFKKIDKELDERVKEKVNIETELRKYMKEEENIHNNLMELNERFREYIENLKKKEEKVEKEENKIENVVKRRSRSPGNNLKKISEKSKAIKKPMGTKLNSKKKNAIYNDLQRSCNLDPLGSSPDEGTNTPDNTPAKRRRLSKKIQRQLNTLFEDE